MHRSRFFLATTADRNGSFYKTFIANELLSLFSGASFLSSATTKCASKFMSHLTIIELSHRTATQFLFKLYCGGFFGLRQRHAMQIQSAALNLFKSFIYYLTWYQKHFCAIIKKYFTFAFYGIR